MFFKRILLALLLLISEVACTNSPVGEGVTAVTSKLMLFYVENVTSTSAKITWSCSNASDGIVAYGKEAWDNVLFSAYPSHNHSMTLEHLDGDTRYIYTVFCGGLGFSNSSRQYFITNPPEDGLATARDDSQNATITLDETSTNTSTSTSTVLSEQTKDSAFTAIKKRGIWLVGGIGTTNNTPVSQIDLFDPVTSTWYSSVTTLPTPRAYAVVVSFKEKIYVIGGLVVSGSTLIPSNIVEVYDPSLGTWTTMNNITRNLSGAVGGVSGNNIYILGGTTSSDMTTGTILNTIYRFTPEVGTGGTWAEYTSQNSIYPRIDMSGCSYNGSIFFTNGRRYDNGLEQATSDIYVAPNNTVSSITEASTNTARHGSGAACYRPIPTDTNPGDTPAVLIVGGSTATNTVQPPSALTPSNTFDYYALDSTTNTFTSGGNLPFSLYYPAIEISYENRKAYVFGGATGLNSPVNVVLSLDLSNPTGNAWVTESTTMPVARYGHQAVILSR